MPYLSHDHRDVFVDSTADGTEVFPNHSNQLYFDSYGRPGLYPSRQLDS
jgi:hypothetical protein